MKIATALLGITLSLVATAKDAPLQVHTYDHGAHQLYAVDGFGEIKGQAFLRQQGGGVVTCAGSVVFLMPDTPYFNEVIELLRRGKEKKIQPPPPAAQTVVRNAQCDAQGNFEIHNVPRGKWIVGTDVAWMVGYRAQGGSLMRKIEVEDHKTLTVLLTDSDRAGWL